VPFYKSVLRYFKQNGVAIVNAPDTEVVCEEFSYLTTLKNLKLNTPKTAIFPSKSLPYGVNGDEMQNLQYPLDWDNMFESIGFPANIKSNNSAGGGFYDCFRIYNKQDFYFIYDMSGTNTLVLQECIDTQNNFRIFVVGNEKLFLNYELHKASKDRYSVADFVPDKKTGDEIDKVIETIKQCFSMDMFIIDIAITDKVYILNVGLFSMNINNLILPENCYNWLIEETANMLIEKVLGAKPRPKSTTVAAVKTVSKVATAAPKKAATTTKATAPKKATTTVSKSKSKSVKK
jgi:glutathione synthase/RimK-type ligase-like ATP-grasp enzyme